MGCTPSTIVRWGDSLGVLLPDIVRRGRGSRAVINTLFGYPPVRARSAPPLIRRRTSPSPSLPVIPVISFSVPIPVIDTFPLTLTAATRATRPLTRPIGGGWRPPIPVVAPNRRWWILGPLEKSRQLSPIDIGGDRKTTNLDAQTVPIKIPPVPGTRISY